MNEAPSSPRSASAPSPLAVSILKSLHTVIEGIEYQNASESEILTAIDGAIQEHEAAKFAPVVDFFKVACDAQAVAAEHIRKLVGVTHGVDCPKIDHAGGGGFMHTADDDTPYDVDGVAYCGRCHHCLPPAQTDRISVSRPSRASQVRHCDAMDAAAFVRECLVSELSAGQLYGFIPAGKSPPVGAILDAATSMVGMLPPEERTRATHSKLAGIAQWARETIKEAGY